MNIKCKYNCCENKPNSEYIKWILSVLGPVILGSKPCEILNISAKDNQKSEKIKDIENFFGKCIKISYEFISMEDGGYRLLFINNKSLINVLNNKKCANFLRFIGYPKSNDVNDYINRLVDKLHSNEFPHEIGIFLGYPLKDVVGFMGYGNYEFYETKAWRIYGEPKLSYETYNRFLEDRNRIKKLINSTSLQNLMDVI